MTKRQKRTIILYIKPIAKGGITMIKKIISGEKAHKKTVWIDKNLHRRLKVLASQNGMKMGLFVETLINKTLEGEKKSG